MITAATADLECTQHTARRLSDEVLAGHARAVDADARFPIEALQALRSERLLGVAVPVELGGSGADVAELSAITTELARGCASTAMIYAMHQIQVLSLLRHGRNPVLLDFVRRVAAEELLLASATTEIGIGGDVRTSGCAVERSTDGRRVSLTKNAPVISYGQYADAVLATARRSADAGPSDQVLLVCTDGASLGDDRPVAGGAVPARFALEQISGWDTLGMRGTCSNGFRLSAEGPAELVLDDPYETISSSTMLPVSHLLWSAVWLGIARHAESVARRFVQAESRRTIGRTPPGALRLAELAVTLQRMEATVQHAVAQFGVLTIGADMSELAAAVALNTLKISASELVVDVVGQALGVCGINGYRNDSPYSLARSLRDAHGAAVMISNERVLHNNAQLLLGLRER